MASIRRTLSPYSDRSHPTNPFAPHQSPSQKLFSQSPTTLSPVRRFITAIFLHKSSNRKSTSIHFSSKNKSLLLFFFLGFLLGMAPFHHDLNNDDLKRRRRDLEETDDGIKPAVVKGMDLVENENDDVAVELGGVDRIEQLILVTPTYNRAMQAYYLNRLGHVLRLVRPPVLWIVVEMNAASMETGEILGNMGVMYRHLVCRKNSTDVKDRGGVHQRNTALEHIGRHKLDGIVSFADDDNIYSLELLESIREISRFGTWPVGMLAQSKNKAILEGPVCNGSQVIGWHTNEKSKRLRRFHVDMSGFAFNSTILWDPKRWHRPTSDPIRQLDTVKEGFQETSFIEQIVEDESQMEGIPSDCFKIMNWHLHLEAHEIVYPKGWMLQKNLDVVIPSK